MKTFQTHLKEARESSGLTLQELSATTSIDVAILSKIERGLRAATTQQFEVLVTALHIPKSTARASWLSDKILKEVGGYEELALEALQVAEASIKYHLQTKKTNFETYSETLQSKLQQCDALLLEWQKKRPLDLGQIRKMEEYFRVNYTFESNRIEGNTLTMQETHLVVNEGITIGGKSMREHLEAINHHEAIDFLYDLIQKKTVFSERVLKDLHYLILKGIDRENAGKYRNVPVRIGGSSFMPPQPYLVPVEMEQIFDFYERQKSVLHPVVLAAELHERIVTVHPFIDGNGRTCRLVMNLILLSHGYPLANLKGEQAARLRYYDALTQAQVHQNKEPFLLLIADAVIQSLQDHLELT